jgi:repressor LexA
MRFGGDRSMKVSKEQVGQLIRSRRNGLGLTQFEVARQIPISRPNYTKWENGDVDIAVSDLQAVAEILKVPMSYFFPDDGQ